MTQRIPPMSGTAFTLEKGDYLSVIDPEGQQVADLIAFNLQDTREVLSSGRSIDYAGGIFFSAGSRLYSNRSRVMLSIVHDDVGRHDFTLTPCSADTFRILYGHQSPARGCEGNLEEALGEFGIARDQIPVTFNVFMHVSIDDSSGKIKVLPPLSTAGQQIIFRADMDMIVGLTACSAGQSNNFSYKPIDYIISKNTPNLPEAK